MDESKTFKIAVSEFIQRLCKQLNIVEAKGLFGNELALIALVRNCQYLYDKNLGDFKNIQKKNETWEAIAGVFGVSVGEVQQRWKGMRDLFNKQRSKNETNPDPNTVLCPYYEYLKFLEPYIVGRRTKLSGVTVQDLTNSDDQREAAPCFDDLKQFIQRIKDTPILFHHKYSGGSYGKQKLASWIEISKTFNVPVEESRARWRTLRERYSRERRMQRNGLTAKKWELFDNLSFLNEHVKVRRRYTYTWMVPNNSSSSKQSVCNVIASPNSSSVAVDSSDFLNQMTSSTKKEIPIEDFEFFNVSNDITSSPGPFLHDENHFSEESSASDENTNTTAQSESTKGNNHLDEDDLFGYTRTIAAELERLPCPRKKITLKAEIYRLLFEHICE